MRFKRILAVTLVTTIFSLSAIGVQATDRIDDTYKYGRASNVIVYGDNGDGDGTGESGATPSPSPSESPLPSAQPTQDPVPSPDPTPQPTPTPTPSPTPSPAPSPTPVPEKYNVKFMLDNGTVLQDQTIESGKTAQRPANPQKDGYNFVGWYNVNNNGELQTEFNFQEPITKQILVYAKFEPKKFKITYHVPDGAKNDNPKDYVYGQGVDKLNDPQLDEYTFEGWYTDSEFKNKVTQISKDYQGDLQLYAKFNKKTYTVEYVLDGGTNDTRNPTSYTFGDYYKIYPPTRAGYTFAGWFENPDFTGQRTQIDPDNKQNFKLYAKWDANEYNINYVLAGGNLPEDAVRTYKQGEGLAELPTPVRSGYIFDGWYSDDSRETKITGIQKEQTGDVIVYASWTAGAIQITYNLNGGTNNPENPNSYKIGQGKVTLLDPTRDEYRFLGWYSDYDLTKQVYFIDGQTDNLTLYAKWEYVGTPNGSNSGSSDSNSQNGETSGDSGSTNGKGDGSSNKDNEDSDKKITPVVILISIWAVMLLILGAVWIAFIVKRNSYSDSDDSDDDYDSDDDDSDSDSIDYETERYDRDAYERDINTNEYDDLTKKYSNVEQTTTWMKDVGLKDIVNNNKGKQLSLDRDMDSQNMPNEPDDMQTRLVDIDDNQQNTDEELDIDGLLDDLNGDNKQ